MMPSLPRRAALHGLLALVASALAAAPALAQRGALTLPRNLSQLVEGSADIVRGTVMSARVEKHPQLPHLDTIVVTLRVDETIKGAPAKTYTFRQYIWDIRDREDRAGYFKGQSYLLLMNAPSRFGLTSPVGMDQGRFRLKRLWWRADRITRPPTALPVRPIGPADAWSEDPADRRYNRPVRRGQGEPGDRLMRDDALYDLIVEIDHNDRPRIAGRGSAVFIHVARAGFGPTAGCVALRRDHLLQLLKKLSPRTWIHIG